MKEYRIRLMPRAEDTYRELKSKAARLPPDRRSPAFYDFLPYAKMLERVNQIFLSLLNPDCAYLDEPLLEALSWIRTRGEAATLVYFLRSPAEIKILHITDCESV